MAERPTYQQLGFFEGVYDYMPNIGRACRTSEELYNYMPYMGRWSHDHARPVFQDFPKGIVKHLGQLSLPWRQTNQLMQVGMQYHADIENNDRRMPDAYRLDFSRYGRLGKADIQKSLTVSVMRATLAAEMRKSDDEGVLRDDVYRSWKQVAETGERFDNAVIATQLDKHWYRGLVFGTTDGKRGELQPADEALAQDVFDTVYYWQE
jgi:hypothetical protein